MNAPLVVGLDLSITATGIALSNGHTLTVGGKAELGDLRLDHIAIETRIATEDVDLVVIEDLAVHGPGNGMAAAQVMGAVKVTLLAHRTPYALVPPATLKKYATSKGNATKADMAVALYKRAGLELPNDNEVDAWWLRAAGLHHLGHPIVDVPATQAATLNRITWPEVRRG